MDVVIPGEITGHAAVDLAIWIRWHMSASTSQIVMNRRVRTALDVQAITTNDKSLSIIQYNGNPTCAFTGIPIVVSNDIPDNIIRIL